MSAVSSNRLFSMPAFEALRAVRRQAQINNGLTFDELIEVVKNIDPDSHGFDFEAAIVLDEIVAPAVLNNGQEFYQACISSVLLKRQPTWAKLMTLGRGRFISKIDRDEQSIFREAGLLAEPPTDELIKWWDHIKGHIRLAGDQLKLDIARKAEKLSLENEKNRLMSIGIVENPKWIAIEDDTAGYDVHSYEKNAYGLTNKLIEVKSTVASPLRFIITRHEWNQALQYRTAYFFHVWDMDKNPPILYERSVSQIEPHIPQDNEKGKWRNAEIPVGI